MTNSQRKKLASKIVHKNPWFSVTEDEIAHTDGSQGKHYVIHKPKGAVIIPFDGDKVALVNVYRHALGDSFWELPMGGSESGEELLQTAKRELKEETGFRAKQWTKICKFAPSPGDSGLVCTAFLAEELKPGEPERGDGDEQDMEVKQFSIAEIDELINSGVIIDSWTIVPWHFFKEHLKNK